MESLQICKIKKYVKGIKTYHKALAFVYIAFENVLQLVWS